MNISKKLYIRLIGENYIAGLLKMETWVVIIIALGFIFGVFICFAALTVSGLKGGGGHDGGGGGGERGGGEGGERMVTVEMWKWVELAV